MTDKSRWAAFKAWVSNELQQLTTIHRSDRLWQIAFASALAIGLPLLIGAYFDHLNYGLVASLGGLSILYMPNTPLSHRMVTMMACAFAITACYTLGVISHSFQFALAPMIIFVTMMVMMIVRIYMLGPPGALFFVMAAAIGAYAPVEVTHVPHMVGLISMGALLACVIAFFYSVYALRIAAPKAIASLSAPSFDYVVFDSVMIGLFVGLSLVLAQALQLQRPYWVPVSCLAVIQGASLRAIWNRQLHRILGTSIGMLFAWALLLLPLTKWGIAVVLMALSFIVEILIGRHYATAIVFVTPLAILLAEAGTFGQGSAANLVSARFLDTVLGCVFGLAGGACLHNSRFREIVGKPLRCLVPARFSHKERD
jgi:hypothetical protein